MKGNNKKRKMFLKMIFSSLIRRRSRMAIALLAIIIGSTVFMGMMTVYADIERQMGNEFRSYGANFIIVSASGGGMSAEDAEKAESYLLDNPDVKIAGTAYYRYESARINNSPVILAGTKFDDVKKVSPFWSVAGEYPADVDEAFIGKLKADLAAAALVGGRDYVPVDNAGEILIGGQTAEFLGVTTGSVIVDLRGMDAGNNRFGINVKVAGIVNTGGNEEALIFLDIDELNAIMGDEAINVIECNVTASADTLNSIAAAIKSDEADINAYVIKQLTNSESIIMGKLTTLLFLVTAVVLLLTMVCVSTTMTAVVAERRKEIGLKKAIGASSKDILAEFIGENVGLGLIGGVFGIVLGYFLAILISENVFSSTAVFRWWLIPLTLVVSLIVTVAACLLPIKNASTVEPALVLKGE